MGSTVQRGSNSDGRAAVKKSQNLNQKNTPARSRVPEGGRERKGRFISLSRGGGGKRKLASDAARRSGIRSVT